MLGHYKYITPYVPVYLGIMYLEKTLTIILVNKKKYIY
jgi:hypothetical protein